MFCWFLPDAKVSGIFFLKKMWWVQKKVVFMVVCYLKKCIFDLSITTKQKNNENN